MSGVWGRKIKYTIFGESHGKGIGIVIDGLPSGLSLDEAFIQKEMARRAPGSSEFSTPRVEKDQIEILSGLFQGKTTGTPLCAIIINGSQKSKDYDKMRDIARPGHADITGYIKYKGFNDFRGGGHFSGRITAPIVFAGAVAKQILAEKNVFIGSHIYSICDIRDLEFQSPDLNEEVFIKLSESGFPILDSSKGEGMKELIRKAKSEKDSLGGIIEAAIINVPCGLGDPFFDSMESNIAHLLFSIPAVKGVEFGAGFDITKMKGSESNDPLYMEGDQIKTSTNHNGGILGGITSGMPIIFRAAFKPTPSIGKAQKTINFDLKEDTQIEVTGRHDPCIVPRALPVVEACAALSVLDFM